MQFHLRYMPAERRDVHVLCAAGQERESGEDGW